MKESENQAHKTSSSEKVGTTRIDTYSLCLVEDIQEAYDHGKLYLVGPNGNFWLTVFHCPCGCGELLELLLLDNASPHWEAEINDDEQVCLSPSIWKIHDCKSHFFIKNSRVVWVSKHDMEIQMTKEEKYDSSVGHE